MNQLSKEMIKLEQSEFTDVCNQGTTNETIKLEQLETTYVYNQLTSDVLVMGDLAQSHDMSIISSPITSPTSLHPKRQK